MADNNPIRPEIRGLFEKIREQAVKYDRAFEKLEKDREFYDYFIAELKKQVLEFYKVINNDFYSIKQKYDDVIKILNIETNKTLEKYAELHNLQELQESYFNAVQEISRIQVSLEAQTEFLKKESNAFINLLNEVKNKATKEADKFLESAEEKLQQAIRKETSDIEEKLMTKLVSVEKRIVYFDQIYWAFQDKYRDEVRNFYKEMDALKSLFGSINTKTGDGTNFHFLEIELNNKIDELRKELHRLEERNNAFESVVKRLPKSLQEPSETIYPQNSDEKKFAEINKKLSKLAHDGDTLRKSLTTATVVGAIAIIGALLAVVLAIFK